jgi:cytochrome c oxidase subunit II
MRRYWREILVAVIFSVAGTYFIRPSMAQSEVHEIRMTAKKYEYSPVEIHVKQGEKVRLLITATDRKHGFEIKELGIKTDLEKGQETPVEFVADKAGTFEFHCSNFCGLGHGRMKGRLIVEAAEETPSAN